MAATTTKADVSGLPPLPPITGSKMRSALVQLDLMVELNAGEFIEHGQAYRQQHRDATSRPLTAIEVAQIAAAFDAPLPQVKKDIDRAKLTAHDEPQPMEILARATVATSPALYDSVLRLTALLEMPNTDYANARDRGDLDTALTTAVAHMDDEELGVLRQRVGRAWGHLGEAMGHEPGKAWGLIAQTLWKTISQGMSQLATAAATASSTSSTSSPQPTDGADEPSSTRSPG